VARWLPLDGETRLVNRQGEVFAADTPAVLPTFAGPADAAPRMLARYSEFSAALSHIQRRPVALALSSRESWRITLDDGMVLALGRDSPQAPVSSRLNRFIEYYATLRTRLHGVALVDLRYPNGFALRTGKS
jgi:cell division protein FtsQ